MFKRYLYIEKRPTFSIVIPSIFLIVLLILPFQDSLKIEITFLISLFLIFGIVFWSSRDGIEIDFENKNYRKVTQVLGMNYGIWKRFSKPEYIAIFGTTVKQTIGGRGFQSSATASVSQKMIIINFFFSNETHSTVFRIDNKEVAIEVAEKLTSFFDVPLVNKL